MPGARGARGDVPFAGWFEEAFGFVEAADDTTRSRVARSGDAFESKASVYDSTRQRFSFTDGILQSQANGQEFHVGAFDIASLSELQSRSAQAGLEASVDYWRAGGLSFQNVVGNTRELIGDAENAGAVFQVATLFNCLQTLNGAEPEAGVANYSWQPTQGAACALACPAATVFRNYFVNEDGQGGQGQQLNCLSAVGDVVQNSENMYWNMRNGYCMPMLPGSLGILCERLASDAALTEQVRSKVQVGIHWDTEVWTGNHRVCQVFCSALPCAVVRSTESKDWAPLARAILDAEFDATLAVAATLAMRRGARVKVFLTVLGGGVLANRRKWIAEAIERALLAHAAEPLDVFLVHFGALPTDQLASLGKDTGTCASSSLPSTLRPSTATAVLAKPRAAQKDVAPVDADLTALAGGDAKRIIRLFSRFDANGDGVIETSEFVDVLRTVDDQLFTRRVINMLLAEVDGDDDGVIHYAEFIAWLAGEDPDIVQQVLASTA